MCVSSLTAASAVVDAAAVLVALTTDIDPVLLVALAMLELFCPRVDVITCTVTKRVVAAVGTAVIDVAPFCVTGGAWADAAPRRARPAATRLSSRITAGAPVALRISGSPEDGPPHRGRVLGIGIEQSRSRSRSRGLAEQNKDFKPGRSGRVKGSDSVVLCEPKGAASR